MANNQQHVNYIGRDGKVHELWYADDGGWRHNVLSDLAQATGADDPNNLPNFTSPLDGYVTPWNNQQHVNYTSSDGKAHELFYSDGGGWNHNVLSDLAQATGADDGSNIPAGDPLGLDGYATPWNNQQHINYIGGDNKVHELEYSDGVGWRHNALSDLAQATGADDLSNLANEGELDGYATPWNNQQHVIYISYDGKVHELLYSDDGGWRHNVLSDLAQATGADDPNNLAKPPFGVAVNLYSTPWNKQQHVIYTGSDGKVHELLYSDGGGWRHNVLNELAQATGADDPNNWPVFEGALDGYVTPWNNQQHMNYVGQDGKVHELWYSDGGGWQHNVLSDLAQATGADDPNNLPGNAGTGTGLSALAGYATQWNNQQHVNYVGQDGKVHELWYSDGGGWQHNVLSDLAQATGGDQQANLPNSALTGFDAYVT